MDMINLGISFEKSLSQDFGRITLHKKRSRNTFFYLRKLSRFFLWDSYLSHLFNAFKVRLINDSLLQFCTPMEKPFKIMLF